MFYAAFLDTMVIFEMQLVFYNAHVIPGTATTK